MIKNSNIFLFFFLSVLAIVSCSLRPTNPDCSKFKTGAFYYRSKIDGSETIIERNDSIQTELAVQSNSIVKARIKWISECEYELHYFYQTSTSHDTIVDGLKKKPLKTVILKTGIDYYVFKSTMDGFDMALFDTLKILKDKNL